MQQRSRRSTQPLGVMAKDRLPRDPTALEGRAASFFDAIFGESDRGCVLVAAAFLDEGLELLLRSKMSSDAAVVKGSIDPLFTGIGPLKSFWSKIELCRALKLMPEDAYSDLTAIRSLRNHFAHSYVDATFRDAKAQELVSRLTQWGLAALPMTDKETQKGVADFRRRFSLAAAWHAGAIHKEAGMVAMTPNTSFERTREG